MAWVTSKCLIRTGVNDTYDDKWRRFVPNQRFNVDQSPLSFVIDVKHTHKQIDHKHMEKIWIMQLGSGLDKRQYTLQIMTCPEGEQPQIAIVHYSQGKKIWPDEKNTWHQDIDVY